MVERYPPGHRCRHTGLLEEERGGGSVAPCTPRREREGCSHPVSRYVNLITGTGGVVTL